MTHDEIWALRSSKINAVITEMTTEDPEEAYRHVMAIFVSWTSSFGIPMETLVSDIEDCRGQWAVMQMALSQQKGEN